MAKVLVSLVSDQTIQNVLFIKEYEKKVDKYIFISTNQMEKAGKTQWIIDACNLPPDKIEQPTIVVDAYSLDDIYNKLKEHNFSEDEYIVNITGGTKLMSHAAQEFFKDLGAQLFYITGQGNDFVKVFPKVGQKKFQFSYKVPLIKYLNSYGINVKRDKTTIITNPKEIYVLTKGDYANKFYTHYINFNEEQKEILKKLRLFYRNKGVSDIEKVQNDVTIDEKSKLCKGIPKLSEFLIALEFQLEKENKLSDKEVQFLTGGWFEEYVYLQLLKQIGDISFIGTNIKISKNTKMDNQMKEVDNELDVAFIKNNAIHVIECKTNIFEKQELDDSRGRLFNETIYKLAAIKKDFGLFAKSYIFTLSKIEKNDEMYLNRARLMDIEVYDINKLNNDLTLKNFYSQLR